MKTLYGVLDSNNCHTDISHSLKGTKRYANNHGYTQVSARYNGGYNVNILFIKQGKTWKPCLNRN